jgi:hypothetical protein
VCPWKTRKRVLVNVQLESQVVLSSERASSDAKFRPNRAKHPRRKLSERASETPPKTTNPLQRNLPGTRQISGSGLVVRLLPTAGSIALCHFPPHSGQQLIISIPTQPSQPSQPCTPCRAEIKQSHAEAFPTRSRHQLPRCQQDSARNIRRCLGRWIGLPLVP